MLLYRSLRLFLKGAANVFFVDIESVDEDRIPETGPLIFVANHPNSIMDTVILGTRTPRQVHYMARSGLFANPVVRFIFNRCGVIPVYRQQDNPTKTGSNVEAFQAAWDVLARGGCIGIFPEGRNAPERHVRDLKTGTARIALGAEARHDFELGVKIVPVGLNFEDRDRFLSRVIVSFGLPIDARDYRAAWVADERATVRRLTDDIQGALRNEVVHVGELRSVEFVKDIEAIYGQTLFDSLSTVARDNPEYTSPLLDSLRAREGDAVARDRDLVERLYLKQRLAAALEYFEGVSPERVEHVRQQLQSYKENLAQFRLRVNFSDRLPDTLSMRHDAVKFTLYAVLLAPIFLWGLVNNIAPFWLTRVVSRRTPEEAMRAITALLVGIVLFAVAWTAQGYAVWYVTDSALATLLYLASLPFAGVFALRYRRQVARYRGQIVVRTLVSTRSAMFRDLLAQREQLIDELEAMRQTFMEATMRTED